MRLADVPGASEMSYRSLYAMLVEYHDAFLEPPELRTAETIARSENRIAYLVEQDPHGAWVALDGENHVGIALATRREDQWFLSLLSVATTYQSLGIGKRLLDAALLYARGCSSAWLLSSPDVKAIRRYHAAGFKLQPTYTARGSLERSVLPRVRKAPGGGVRAGELGRDRELVEDIARSRRGSGYGPDLDAYLLRGELFVIDDATGRGYVVAGKGGPIVLGATADAAATSLLWTALAEATDEKVEIGFISGAQQWAIDVAISARLALVFGGSICLRGELGPLVPYLPAGAYG